MAFSRDMVMQMHVNVNWEWIQQKRQKATQATAQCKNCGRRKHKYAVGDKVLIVIKPDAREAKLNNLTEGPYQVLQVYQNGTLKIQRGSYVEIFNIQYLKLYFKKTEQAV